METKKPVTFPHSIGISHAVGNMLNRKAKIMKCKPEEVLDGLIAASPAGGTVKLEPLSLELSAIDYGDLCRASVLLGAGNDPEAALMEFVQTHHFGVALSEWANTLD